MGSEPMITIITTNTIRALFEARIEIQEELSKS